MTNQSTTARGAEFQAQVADALKVCGYSVEGEQLLGHKKVDLIARHQHFGRVQTAAVECKAYERPLSLGAVSKIWGEYEPLYRTNQVDEIILITQSGLSPAAERYAAEQHGLTALTLRELLDSAMDFRSYTRLMAEAFSESSDGVASYYVPPRTFGSTRLDTLLFDWVIDNADGISNGVLDSSRPVAVLGAYGIGKSSLATWLCSELAKRHHDLPTSRIPILIRLSEIANEQSLEGLLGKHFTAISVVPGYSFQAFEAMNRSGRFAIILDGFDEMKALLSWTEFRYNLSQLNRLVTGKSRVILLGRPTAFETDAQHDFALHGIQQRWKADVLRSPDWPDFQEVEIEPLTLDEMRAFLLDYLTYAGSSAASDPAQLEKIWNQVKSKHLRDIARRPVQLRMLAQILPSYTGDVDRLDLVAVYDIFMDHIIGDVIAREEEKRSRLAFSSTERRDFLRGFAYWHWTTSTPGAVNIDVIPDELVAQYAKGQDIPNARRDLLVGSPLDRRVGDRVRFPHRSFQEFLVAEEMWVRLRRGETVEVIDRFLNDEIATFMAQLRTPDDARMLLDLLPTINQGLQWRTWQTLFLADAVVRPLIAKAARSTHASPDFAPSELLLLAACDDALPKQASKYIAGLVARANDLVAYYAFFALVAKGNHTDVEEALRSMLQSPTKEGFTRERFKKRQFKRLTDRYLLDMSVLSEASRWTYSPVARVDKGVSLSVDRTGRVQAESKEVMVYWMSRISVAFASHIHVSAEAATVDLRGLRPWLDATLVTGPHVWEWHAGQALGQINLPTRLAVTRNFADELAELRRAIADLELIPQ